MNLTIPYYPISAILSVKVIYRGVKTKENFKILALKVVVVTYERWSLTSVSKYSDLTWLLTRGGHNQRFNCITVVIDRVL